MANGAAINVEAAALLEAVYDNAPVGLAHHDLYLRYLGVNKMFATMHGVTMGAHSGKTPEQFLPAHLAGIHRANCECVLANAAPIIDRELRIESPRHEMAMRDWRVSYLPLHDAAARLAGVSVVAMDVTERRNNERRLKTERRVAQVLGSAEELDEALPSALDAILESFDMRFCEFWTQDEEGQLKRQILRTAKKPESDTGILDAIPLAFGEGLIGQVTEALEPIYIADVKTDPQFRRKEAARSLGLCTGFAFPVMVDEACIGVISFFSQHRLEAGPSLPGVLARLGQEIGQFVHRAGIKRAARENEARTRIVVDSALDAVISIDDDGRVLRWNPRAEELFGWSHDEALGVDLAELIIPESMRSAHHAGMKTFLQTGVGPVLNKRIEVKAIRRDGAEFPVELTVLPLKLEKSYEFSAYIRDITERKRVEAELIDADRRKTEFLAILGHELRNPLATIASCVSLIEEDAGSAPEMAAVMKPQVEQLRFLLDDLLDITRITRGKIALHRRVVKLGAVLGGAIDATRSVMGERRQVLKTDFAALADREFYADATRVQQIVGNLLTNAAKYSPMGSTVTLSARLDDDRLIVAVADEGIGIPAERIDDIFEPFTQIRETATGAGGLGIGLTLVRELTEMHGGEARVLSRGAGGGSVFEVSFPSAVPDGAVPRECEPVARPALAPDFRVLIVDDNENAAQTLGLLLGRSTGCQTEVVFDGASALAAARAHIPDAMVVDIQLPDISGLDIAAAVRGDPRFARTRLVALSGFGHQEAIEASLGAGFEVHLPKPAGLNELLEALTGPRRQ